MKAIPVFFFICAFIQLNAQKTDSLNQTESVRLKTPAGIIQITAADSSRAGALSASDKKKLDKTEVVSSIAELRSVANRRSDVLYRLINNRLKNVSDLYWNPTSTAKDDSVMVFKVPGVETGRFLRYYEEVYAEWFGAIPDDGIDDSFAFQKAIDFCIRNGRSARLKCGGGVFNVKNLVIADYASGNARYVSFSLEGVAPAYDASSIAARMTEFSSTDPQAFTIAIQHGANVTIRNISFRGMMGGPSGIDQCIQWKDSDWNHQGTIRDNINSPHAAIVIDPFTADIPAANRYPGALSYYSNTVRTGSSSVNIEGCAFQRYIVAIMVSPNPSTTNADNIVFNTGVQSANKIFWASGQRQSRDNQIHNLYSLGGTNLLLDGKGFGQQTGTLPSVANASIAGITKYLYNADVNFGSIKFSNSYMEGLWSFGRSGGGFPVVFENCDINLNYDATLQSPVLAEGGPVLFRGGYLTRFDNTYANGFIFANRYVSFDGTTIQGGVPINYFPGNDAYGNLGLDNVFYDNTEYGSTLRKGVYYSEAQQWLQGFVIPEMLMKGSLGMTYSMEDAYFESNLLEKKPIQFNASGLKAWFLSSNPKMYSVGNFLVTNTPVDYANDIYTSSRTGLGWVSAIRKDTIEISYPPFGLKPGYAYDINAARIKRFFPRMLGTVTAGSNIVSKLVIAQGMGLPLPGSYIKGTGIPANTRVVSATPEKLVLSQPATANADLVEFYDARIRATGVQGGAELSSSAFLFYFGDILKNYNRDNPKLDYIRITAPGAPLTSHPPAYVNVSNQ